MRLNIVNPFKDVFSIKLMVGASNHVIVATGVITSTGVLALCPY
ncbi:MAG: hypothetical protein U5K79_03265 [Cyclobacteriaceae bacterium]|nr:hypothetical protein [Cyclobacteriaceae bacterium]